MSLHFLADENMPRALVEALRAIGHDVDWVRTTAQGLPDEMVLAMASRDGQILLAFDKDFGELPANRGGTGIGSIVLIRVVRAFYGVFRAFVEGLHDRPRAWESIDDADDTAWNGNDPRALRSEKMDAALAEHRA